MELTLEELNNLKYDYKSLCVETESFILDKIKPSLVQGVSSRTTYYWKNGEKPIQVKYLIDLCKENKIINIPVKTISVNGGNKIDIPKQNNSFAYFLGILLGDGCLMISKDKGRKKSYALQISANKKRFANKIQNIAKNLFGISGSIYPGEGCYNLCIYSKALVLFLNSVYDIPIGVKYCTIKVPSKIKTKEEIIYFLKGMIDTDGNFYLHKNKTCFQLRQKSGDFLNGIYDLFHQIDIPVNRPYYDKANNSWVIWASKTSVVDKFINETSALKH